LHIAELQNARNPGAAAAVIKAMAPGKVRARLERRFRLARIRPNLLRHSPSTPLAAML
jgi:hypothetical protein